MSNHMVSIDDPLAQYIISHTVREHPAQAALREVTLRHPKVAMLLSPVSGQFLSMLVKLLDVRRAIEVGVFTGYSALTLALAMHEEGRLLACEINEDFVRVGKPFWEQAGVAHKIDLQLAPAVETLDARLAAGEAGSYDFAFIDADKNNYDAYYERCLKLVRAGGLIAIDNVLWHGRVLQPLQDADTLAVKALNKKLHLDERIDQSLVTIGDGMTLIRKRSV